MLFIPCPAQRQEQRRPKRTTGPPPVTTAANRAFWEPRFTDGQSPAAGVGERTPAEPGTRPATAALALSARSCSLRASATHSGGASQDARRPSRDCWTGGRSRGGSRLHCAEAEEG